MAVFADVATCEQDGFVFDPAPATGDPAGRAFFCSPACYEEWKEQHPGEQPRGW